MGSGKIIPGNIHRIKRDDSLSIVKLFLQFDNDFVNNPGMDPSFKEHGWFDVNDERIRPPPKDKRLSAKEILLKDIDTDPLDVIKRMISEMSLAEAKEFAKNALLAVMKNRSNEQQLQLLQSFKVNQGI